MEGASQTEHLMPWLGAFAVGSAFVAMAGRWASMRLGQPLLEIVARWSRITAFSLGFTYLTYAAGWWSAESRPPWSMVLFLSLGCLLFETVRTWLKVRGFSYEEKPLFPRYFRHEESDDWPTDSMYIRLREWIRGQGFRQVEVLRAYPFPELCIREFHFDSKDGLTRLSVNFIPRGLDTLYVSQTASSVTTDGNRYVTDNAFVPHGGCFPDNWILDRKPLNRSPAKLLKRHHERMEASGKDFSPWRDLPLDDVKEQHRLLKKADEERGDLNPPTN